MGYLMAGLIIAGSVTGAIMPEGGKQKKSRGLNLCRVYANGLFLPCVSFHLRPPETNPSGGSTSDYQKDNTISTGINDY